MAINSMKNLKSLLDSCINEICDNPNQYLVNPDKDYSRKRKLPLKTVIRMLIGMGSDTLSKELYEWFGYNDSTATVSAFIQQRKKLKSTAFEDLFSSFISKIDEKASDNDYKLLAVDGSDLRLPTCALEEDSYFKNHEDTRGYNIMHLDALYDLTEKIYIDAIVQSKKTMSEHKALVTMIDRSKIESKVILIADRGYESFNNMAHCQEKGWNFIIRAKESYGIISRLQVPENCEFDLSIEKVFFRRQTREIRELINKDSQKYSYVPTNMTFDYLERKDKKSYQINFRAVRFKISENDYETVYTNLDATEFPPQKIKELYNKRWNIEVSFRNLKYRIGLTALHSKKRQYILQEVFARLIMFNFTSKVAAIAEKEQKEEQRIINFSEAARLCKKYFKEQLSETILLKLIKRYISYIRLGRQYPRYTVTPKDTNLLYRPT